VAREDSIRYWIDALGLEGLGIEWRTSEGEITGHIEIDIDLTTATVSLDPTLDDEEWEVALVHEMLHAAFRHAVEISKAFMPEKLHALAWEEDTERLALRLVKNRHG
jgi:hypothetical protein